MNPVTPLFSDRQPGPEADDVGPGYVEMARAIANICSVRILLMITTLTGSAIWGYAVIEPSRDRLFSAIAFSIVFVIPQVALSWRKA